MNRTYQEIEIGEGGELPEREFGIDTDFLSITVAVLFADGTYANGYYNYDTRLWKSDYPDKGKPTAWLKLQTEPVGNVWVEVKHETNHRLVQMDELEINPRFTAYLEKYQSIPITETFEVNNNGNIAATITNGIK